MNNKSYCKPREQPRSCLFSLNCRTLPQNRCAPLTPRAYDRVPVSPVLLIVLAFAFSTCERKSWSVQRTWGTWATPYPPPCPACQPHHSLRAIKIPAMHRSPPKIIPPSCRLSQSAGAGAENELAPARFHPTHAFKSYF